ncbi:MAG: hypothetical protein J6Y41_04965 [Bacteroidaceae bacterium]|nr:hypothetical protein [Bacteroidaceae bacterium]
MEKSIFRIIMVLILLTHGVGSMGQTPYKRSSLIRELKYNIKDGEYKKAIDNVKRAFEQYPEETRQDADYYYYNVLANHNLGLEEAKKMYLQDKPDTTKYFGFVYTTVVNALTCDSLGMIPNGKGRVNNKYHKDMQNILDVNVPKLPAASKYFFQKQDYGKAYDFADLYISMNDSADEEVCTVAAVAVLSAYAQNEYKKAVKHDRAALVDSNRHEQLLEVVCLCYEQLKDTVNYELRLEEGTHKYPKNKYFYASLANLYNSQHKYNKALETIKEVIKADCCNRDLWYIKGTEEMHLSERDSALCSFIRATEIQEDDAESHSRIGNIYLIKSHDIYEQQKTAKGKELKMLKEQLNITYKNAKAAYEQARRYAEERTELWLLGLKEVYYKLNMGKELLLLEKKYPQ